MTNRAATLATRYEADVRRITGRQTATIQTVTFRSLDALAAVYNGSDYLGKIVYAARGYNLVLDRDEHNRRVHML